LTALEWTHAGGSALAAFLASAVEFVEALTIVLAVGAVRGWRGALAGAGLGGLALIALVALFGPALTRVPLGAVQLVVGGLLLLFGLRWLRKAILRAAGVIPLHDEARAYLDEAARLRALSNSAAVYDPVAVAASLKAVMLEGVEVVFIVLGVSAGGSPLGPAAAGAGAALVLVVALGLALRRPLQRVPENELKFVVGVLLTAFGVFWVGEGVGGEWPGGDISLPALVLGFLAVALIGVAAARRIVTAGEG
jgi:Ca2+/H+ antiporter, TMEM165/GDT1 family